MGVDIGSGLRCCPSGRIALQKIFDLVKPAHHFSPFGLENSPSPDACGHTNHDDRTINSSVPALILSGPDISLLA
jgi:hypothetical protein